MQRPLSASSSSPSSSSGLRTFYELDGESPRDTQPPGVFSEGVHLMPHQLTLLRKCRDMEERSRTQEEASRDVSASSRLGLIGDKSGAGKSLVIMALCSASARRNDTEATDVLVRRAAPSSATEHVLPSFKSVKTNVMVVPHGLVRQWEDGLRRFTNRDALRWRVFSKAHHFKSFMEEVAKRVDHILASETIDGGIIRRAEIETFAVAQLLDEVDILVITASHWEKYMVWLLHDCGIAISRMIVEEADTSAITAFSVSMVCYEFCWFVTASVHHIISDAVTSLGNGVLNLNTDAVPTSVGFVRKVWRTLVAEASASGAYALRVIRTIVAKNSDAYVDTCLDVSPPTFAVLECGSLGPPPPKKKDSVLPARRISVDSAIELFEGDGTTRDSRSVRDRITDGLVSCCVCLDPPPPSEKVVMRCCAQVFCASCISRWVARLRERHRDSPSSAAPCPVCKTPVRKPLDTLLLVDPSQQQHETEQFDGNALETLLKDELRGSRGDGRILVFVKDAATELAVAKTVNRCGKRSDSLRGTGDRIAGVVGRYKSHDLDVLLLTPGSHGAGLNLEETTDVMLPLHMDDSIRRRVLGSVLRRGIKGSRSSSASDSLRVWYITAPGETTPER